MCSSDLKLELGNAACDDSVHEMQVKGRDLVRGFPRTVTVHSDEIREALEEPVQLIVDAVVASLERTPPELLGDIVDRGIIMTGGGSLLKRLDYVISQATGLPVIVADDPLSAVVKGSGRALEEIDLLGLIS